MLLHSDSFLLISIFGFIRWAGHMAANLGICLEAQNLRLRNQASSPDHQAGQLALP